MQKHILKKAINRVRMYGIICSTLVFVPQPVPIVHGTIAAAAVINEFIAVIAAKKTLKRQVKFKSRTIGDRNELKSMASLP